MEGIIMGSASIAAGIATTRKVFKYGKQVVMYIKEDQTTKLGLLEPVHLTIKSPGIGIGNFTSPDEVFTMESPTEDALVFDVKTFPADEHSIWNGPDVLPNKSKGDLIKGATPGSLFHDFVCHYIEEIAQATGLSVEEVWKWAAGVLALVWDYYGGGTTRSKIEAYIGYNVVRLFRKPYAIFCKFIKRFWVIMVLSCTLMGCESCTMPPKGEVVGGDIIWVENGVVTTNTTPTQTRGP